MPPGSLRILMSMRAVGEGHISSVAFREGIVTDENLLKLAPEPPFATAADALGDELVEAGRRRSPCSATAIPRCRARSSSRSPQQQSKGLEDLRLVRFDHGDGDFEWIGTYTAYNGSAIQSELMRTRDFRSFDLVPMTGPAARNKGMALFPRKIDGRYMMIGRQDGENLFLIDSDTAGPLGRGRRCCCAPNIPWEFVQIGNCGPPIELDEGWLLLTHGVGAMRKYAIGAVLLDKDGPVEGDRPHQTADPRRGGSGPGGVCAQRRLFVRRDPARRQLFVPYGVADSSIAFAFIPVKSLLAQM